MSHVASQAWQNLTTELDRAGYYPELIRDVVDIALAGEEIRSFLVLTETTFDASEIRRHLTVLVLTPSRFLASHVDDHPADSENPSAAAATTTECVPLGEIRSVAISHVVSEPQRYRAGDAPLEVTLAVGWGANARIDLEPAQCPDPECDADHGLTGQLVPDDVVVRISADAEGRDATRAAVDFARALSAATSHRFSR